MHATVEGKVGHRWHLWVFHAPDRVAFVLSPTRAHEAPEDHLGDDGEGVLVVDRYAAYKAMEQVKRGDIVPAFCWGHVRRDFPRVGKGHPRHAAWANEWVARIGTPYHRNGERCDALAAAADAPTLGIAGESPAEPPDTEQQRRLGEHLAETAKRRDEELAEPTLADERRKALASLREHWAGLAVFADRPDVPPDDNAAERSPRGPVVGRKNSAGSGSEWSGRLPATLFGLFRTISLAGWNPRLTAYLDGCAAAGGKPPADAERFLPWKATEERKREWSFGRAEPAAADSS